MLVATLLHASPLVRLHRVAAAGADLAVTAIVEDSRHVAPGSLFVARPGARSDGRAFIADAVARGAVAVLLEENAVEGVPPGPAILVPAPGISLAAATAALCEAFLGFPSRALHLVGITGTNGKTTTAFLVQQLLRAGGRRCGLIGTVVTDDGVVARPSELTTPPAIELSAAFARMVHNGCVAAAMECSSHALHQGRTAGLRFAVGVFTNLTGDHLDYHGSMEAYADAKALLFAGLEPGSTAVINVDAPGAERMRRDCRARVLACSIRDPRADFFAHLEALEPGSTTAMVTAPWGRFRLQLPLVGVHNLMNALEAAATVHALGVEGAVIERALASCSAPPGRLEPVTARDDDCTVLVDYAHTDDALENVLKALRALVPPRGRLRVLFGCGGDRDPTKRPRMAAVAARLADEMIVTSDNPRTEDPEKIVDQIMAGVPPHRREVVRRIVDRADAIAAAIADARPGDVIAIAGKGHEDYQIIGTTKRPFDDRLVAKAALAKRGVPSASVCGA